MWALNLYTVASLNMTSTPTKKPWRPSARLGSGTPGDINTEVPQLAAKINTPLAVPRPIEERQLNIANGLDISLNYIE